MPEATEFNHLMVIFTSETERKLKNGLLDRRTNRQIGVMSAVMEGCVGPYRGDN